MFFIQEKRGGKIKTSHMKKYQIYELVHKPERREVFNFKNEECQEAFFNVSSVTSKLSECFSSDQPFLVHAKRWSNELNNIFHQTLKKVRVIEGKPKEN